MQNLSVYMRAAGALAAGFVSLSSAVAGDGFLVMDMVHHNPGDTPFESKFLDPAYLAAMGSGAKVDATAVKIADIGKTYQCPLAHMLRKRLHSLKKQMIIGIKYGLTKRLNSSQRLKYLFQEILL